MLRNAAGVEVHVWPVGAAIQKLVVPDRAGRLADVVLGFDDVVQYQVRSALFQSQSLFCQIALLDLDSPLQQRKKTITAACHQ